MPLVLLYASGSLSSFTGQILLEVTNIHPLTSPFTLPFIIFHFKKLPL